jgi:hypothetical protein
MRKLIPVLLLSFFASAAYSQSASDRVPDNGIESFAESLRSEIVLDIKKKLSTDTSLQRSQNTMGELLKACGVHPAVKVAPKADIASVYKSSPVTLANMLNDFARTFMDAETSSRNN